MSAMGPSPKTVSIDWRVTCFMASIRNVGVDWAMLRLSCFSARVTMQVWFNAIINLFAHLLRAMLNQGKLSLPWLMGIHVFRFSVFRNELVGSLSDSSAVERCMFQKSSEITFVSFTFHMGKLTPVIWEINFPTGQSLFYTVVLGPRQMTKRIHRFFRKVHIF